MKTYDEEIKEEAVSFLLDHRDLIIDAIKRGADFDYNDIENLDQIWDEEIVDRSYSIEDAIYILENCENEHEGFEGAGDDWQTDITARAAYSFGDDVWFKVLEHYNCIKERFNSLMENSKDGSVEGEATQAFDVWEKEYAPDPIKPLKKGSDNERKALMEWLWLNRHEAGMRGGYPLGSSYIDARCGTGHGMPAVKDYVDYDHKLAQKVPWLAGKGREEVLMRFDQLLNEYKRPGQHYTQYRDIDKAFPKSCDITKVCKDHIGYKDTIIWMIWHDNRLTVADIREIGRTLINRVGDY